MKITLGDYELKPQVVELAVLSNINASKQQHLVRAVLHLDTVTASMKINNHYIVDHLLTNPISYQLALKLI